MPECIKCTTIENSNHNNDCECNSENRCNECPNCNWCIDFNENGSCVPKSEYTSEKCKNKIDFKKPSTKKNHIGGNFIYKKDEKKINNYTILNIIVFILMLFILFIALHYKLN